MVAINIVVVIVFVVAVVEIVVDKLVVVALVTVFFCQGFLYQKTSIILLWSAQNLNYKSSSKMKLLSFM